MQRMGEDGQAQGLRVIAEKSRPRRDPQALRARRCASRATAARRRVACRSCCAVPAGQRPVCVHYRVHGMGGEIEFPAAGGQSRRHADRPVARLARAGERAGRLLTRSIPPRSRSSAVPSRFLPDCAPCSAVTPYSSASAASRARRRSGFSRACRSAPSASRRCCSLRELTGSIAFAGVAVGAWFIAAAAAAPVQGRLIDTRVARMVLRGGRGADVLRLGRMRWWHTAPAAERRLLVPLHEVRLVAVYLATFFLTMVFGSMEVGYPAFATALGSTAWGPAMVAINSIGSALAA